MNTTTIVTIAVIAVLVIMLAVHIYLYVRNSTLEDIRADVYQLFLEAEHKFLHTGSGKAKMLYVIQHTRELLPPWAKIFITDEMLLKVVQLWFDAVKDLLDDGKYNRSTEGTDPEV